MAKKKVETEGAELSAPNVKDELSSILKKSLESQFKDQQIVWDLNGAEESPTEVTDWISTGNVLLDLAISNRKNGGFPVGKIVEIYGGEASGKSLFSCQILWFSTLDQGP